MARFIAKWLVGLVVTLALFLIWQVWSIIPALSQEKTATTQAVAQHPIVVAALARGDNSRLLAASAERNRGQRQEVFRQLIHEHGRVF